MKFNIIVADPAWPFDDRLGNKKGVKRSAEDQYLIMSLQDIMELDVCELSADWSVLALWCPAALLFTHGHPTLEAWGYSYRQTWDWVKTSKLQPPISEHEDIPDDILLAFKMGHLARSCKEHVLIGIKGRVYDHLAMRNERDCFFAPDVGHSIKPEALQDKLERMFGPDCRNLELFARRERANWCCVGNQCPGTEGEDIRDSIRYLKERELSSRED